MGMKKVSPHATVYTAFTFDGTQASIDALNVYLAADGGFIKAAYVNATTWSLLNPNFDDKFHEHDISNVFVFEKTGTQGVTFDGLHGEWSDLQDHVKEDKQQP